MNALANGGPAPGEVFLTAERIQNRVAELGGEITREYDGRPILMVSILKAAFIFLADLSRAVDLPLELDFLAISSYEKESGRAGSSVRFLKDLDHPIEGKDVVIVEDIIDTGLTLHYVTNALRMRNPHSLEICTLLDRPYRRLVDLPVRFRGFTVPDDFFVGYGFDYRQRFRNLPYLAFLDP
ncbi:MAG: hypoxanthine phosphoribosyltransferase [Thermoleophilia bacterium]